MNRCAQTIGTLLAIVLLICTHGIPKAHAHHALDCPSQTSACGTGKDNGSLIVDQSCSCKGSCDAYAGQPVSLRTGNMTISHTDFTIQTGGLPITLKRTYNSHTPSQSYVYSLPQNQMGVGWHHNHESSVGVKVPYNITIPIGYLGGGASTGNVLVSHVNHYYPTEPYLRPSPWGSDVNGSMEYPSTMVLYLGMRSFYFHHKAGSSPVLFEPSKGLGGYSLDQPNKTVTSPQGEKFKFFEKYIDRKTAPNGQYLLYHYSPTLQGNIPAYEEQVFMIHSHLADGTKLRRGMVFNYWDGEDLNASSGSAPLHSAGIVDTNALTTCSNDMDCHNNGHPFARCIRSPHRATGFCSSCYTTYHKIRHGSGPQTLVYQKGCSPELTCMYPYASQEYLSGTHNTSYETDTLYTGTYGVCAKKVVEYEYTHQTVRIPGTTNTGLTDSAPLPYLKEVHFPPFSNINASQDCNTQSNCLAYSYDHVTPNDISKKIVLTSVKDATNTTLEAHAYQDGHHNYHEAPVVTQSMLPEGTLNFTYNYSSPPLNTQGSKETTVTKTSVLNPTYSECTQTKVEPHLSRVGELFRQCGKTATKELREWKRAKGSQEQPGELFPFVRLLSSKAPNKNAFTTFSYQFDANHTKMESRTATYGDDDNNGGNTPASSTNALQVKTYFHPNFTKIPIGFETDSIVDLSKKRYVIYDYNATSRCPTNQCPPTSYYQATDTSTKLYRVIVRGWSRELDGSLIEHTRVTSFTYGADGRLQSMTDPSGKVVSFTYYSSTATELEARGMINQVTVSNCTSGGASCVITYAKYNKFGTPTEVTDLNGVVHKVVHNELGQVTAIHQDIRTNKSQTSCAAGNTAACAIWTFTRDKAGRIAEVKKPGGGIYLYEYDSYGRQKRVSFKSSSSASADGLVEYVYDDGTGKIAAIKRLQAQDSTSQIISTDFDYAITQSGALDGGRVIKILSGLPNQGQKQLHFNQDGTLAHSIDESGNRVEYSYHPHRPWVTSVKRFIGPGTSNPVTVMYKYNKYGQVTEFYDAKQVAANPTAPQHGTKYTYDDFGQILSIESPDRAPSGSLIRFEYNNAGWLMKKKRARDTLSTPVTFLYDNMGRLLYIDYPTPPAKPNFPMLADNDVTFTYDEDHTSKFTLGRLTKISVRIFDVSGGGSQYMRRVTKYDYDALGRVKSIILEDYDGFNPTPVSTNMEYAYDVDGNLTKSKYPFGPWGAQYGYDARGQLTHVGRLTNYGGGELGVGQYLLAAGYNLPSGLSSAGGLLDSFYYHRQTQHPPTVANITGNEVWSRFRKNNKVVTVPAGGLASSSQAAGHELDSNLQGHAGILFRTYVYQHNGLISAIKCSNTSDQNCYPGNQAKAFTYDGLYRLIRGGEDISGQGRFSYTYDPNGNLTQKQDHDVNGKTWVMEYAADSNRLLRRYFIGQNPTPTGPNYDHHTDGKRKEDPYWKYHYHGNGRLAVMEPKPGNNSKLIFFGYDHRGLRIIKYLFPQGGGGATDPSSADSATMYYHDMGGRLVEEIEYPNFASQSNEYNHRIWFWVGQTPFAAMDIDTKSDGTVIFGDYNYFFDHLGRPIVSVNTTEPQGGGPTWRSIAQPYGKDKGLSLASDISELTDTINTGNATHPLPIQQMPYSANANVSQTIEMIKSGTYGVQFYFETLNLEPGYDFLSIYKNEPQSGPPYSADQLIHTFTGNHQTGNDGNPTSGFWGPVVPVNHKAAGKNSLLGKLVFGLTSDSGVQHDGYKITSYRLWRITDGKTATYTKNDVLPTNGSGEYSAGTSGGSLVWSKTYTQSGAKLMRVYFSAFDTERKYDWVEIRDKDNHIIQVLTGDLGGHYSAWVAGDELKVYFYADHSVQRAGFTVSTVEVRYPMEVRHRFPGQWHDKDTQVWGSENTLLHSGLYYNWHRYYDPDLGRYITPDPIGLAGGSNPFLYADANPAHYTDLYGLISTMHTKEGVIVMGLLSLGGVAAISSMPPQQGCDWDINIEQDENGWYHVQIFPVPFLNTIVSGAVNAGADGLRLSSKAGRAIEDFLRSTFRKASDLGNKIRKYFKKGECFVAGTLVETSKGPKKIEDIEVGEAVLTKRQQAKQPKKRAKPKKKNKHHKTKP